MCYSIRLITSVSACIFPFQVLKNTTIHNLRNMLVLAAFRHLYLYSLQFPVGGVGITLPVFQKLRSIFWAFLAGTFLFLLVVGSITLYMSTKQTVDAAIEAASRLPGRFVADCQQVSQSLDVPWHQLAAYYQTAAENSGSANYPAKKQIQQFAEKLTNRDGSEIEQTIEELAGDNQDDFIERAELLEKSGFMFSGKYMFPVDLKEVSYTDTWLAPRGNGERRHLGTDIFAPEGTPVYAATDGKIIRIGWDTLGGNRIGLMGQEDGIYYYYAHLSKYAPGLEKGSKVSKGSLLGHVGHTGNAVNTPDHLHFGIRVSQDTWVNPYNFLVYWELNKKNLNNP